MPPLGPIGIDDDRNPARLEDAPGVGQTAHRLQRRPLIGYPQRPDIGAPQALSVEQPAERGEVLIIALPLVEVPVVDPYQLEAARRHRTDVLGQRHVAGQPGRLVSEAV